MLKGWIVHAMVDYKRLITRHSRTHLQLFREDSKLVLPWQKILMMENKAIREEEILQIPVPNRLSLTQALKMS